MGRSRYAGTETVDGFHYATWTDPTAEQFAPDILDGIDTVDHVFGAGDRLDLLAHRYYGDEDYWWVIALSNRVTDPFSIAPGTKLRVPVDVRSILNKVQR